MGSVDFIVKGSNGYVIGIDQVLGAEQQQQGPGPQQPPSQGGQQEQQPSQGGQQEQQKPQQETKQM
jgi:hypothetical protein